MAAANISLLFVFFVLVISFVFVSSISMLFIAAFLFSFWRCAAPPQKKSHKRATLNWFKFLNFWSTRFTYSFHYTNFHAKLSFVRLFQPYHHIRYRWSKRTSFTSSNTYTYSRYRKFARKERMYYKIIIVQEIRIIEPNRNVVALLSLWLSHKNDTRRVGCGCRSRVVRLYKAKN